MRAFLRKYGLEIRLAFIPIYAVGIVWISYVKSGMVESKFQFLFYAVGCLSGAVWSIFRIMRDMRIKYDDLAVRVAVLMALAKANTVEPVTKKTEEKLPS